MITDMKVIKKILNEHVEVELPYPFKEGVEIKYITMKNGEQFFSTGGRYVRMLNKKILLQNSGKSWSVPTEICNRDGDIIYKSRFFVHKDFEKEVDSKKVSELESIIKSQQDVIKKLSQQVKSKAEDNEKLKLYIKHKLN
jgi:hypothetical protein